LIDVSLWDFKVDFEFKCSIGAAAKYRIK